MTHELTTYISSISWVYVLLWLVWHLSAKYYFSKMFGRNTRWMNNMPIWRDCCALPLQLGGFLLLSYHDSGREAFRIIFPLFMLSDFFLVEKGFSNLLALHHIVCVVGHCIVVFFLPEGFDTYFAGVVTLEFGSGCMNIFTISIARRRPSSSLVIPSLVYGVGMTLSNALASYVALRWQKLPLSFVPKYFNLLITVIIVVVRQLKCHKNISSVHRPEEQNGNARARVGKR